MTGLENVKLVLTDNRMPGITGIEIIRKYSRKKSFENIPFVLCCTGDESLGEYLLNEGYTFTYLKKPVRLKDFTHTIKEALKIDKKP